MAQGMSVALPLNYDKKDGPFRLNKTVTEVVKQNLKNLILTVQGERIMDPLFGVGIYSYLFENFTTTTTFSIRTEVQSQTKKYMPFIKIEDLIISQSTIDENQVNIKIVYLIQTMNVLDELSFVVTK